MKPSFSGTASETLPVTVKIYSGPKRKALRRHRGRTRRKKWGPVTSSTALSSGTYTAVAEERSSLGNAPAKAKRGRS